MRSRWETWLVHCVLMFWNWEELTESFDSFIKNKNFARAFLCLLALLVTWSCYSEDSLLMAFPTAVLILLCFSTLASKRTQFWLYASNCHCGKCRNWYLIFLKTQGEPGNMEIVMLFMEASNFFLTGNNRYFTIFIRLEEQFSNLNPPLFLLTLMRDFFK